MNRTLTQYVIYEHPLDYPEHFVVRRWEIGEGKILAAKEPLGIAPTLESARAMLPEGLYRIARDKRDDPAIAEVWL